MIFVSRNLGPKWIMLIWFLNYVIWIDELNLMSWIQLFVNFEQVDPELKHICFKFELSFELDLFLSNQV